MDLHPTLPPKGGTRTDFLRSFHVALRRPETMKQTGAIIRADEKQRQVVKSLSLKLVEELGPSRTDVPETVSPARAGRTLRRMPPIVSTPANSSNDAWLKSLITGWSHFADGLRHSIETGNLAAKRQRLKAGQCPQKRGAGPRTMRRYLRRTHECNLPELVRHLRRS
jgi:hypothetical protein